MITPSVTSGLTLPTFHATPPPRRHTDVSWESSTTAAESRGAGVPENILLLEVATSELHQTRTGDVVKIPSFVGGAGTPEKEGA